VSKAYDDLSDYEQQIVCECYEALCRRTTGTELDNLSGGRSDLARIAIDAYSAWPTRDEAIAAKSIVSGGVQFTHPKFALRRAHTTQEGRER
jgi:hypothetical protein